MKVTEKLLTVHNAEIHTAEVQVQTLTIKGRQVTLAVFRQLMYEHLIDWETGNLKGNPWGLVNYHPDRCRDEPEHVHVVWQKGSELRRDTIHRRTCLPKKVTWHSVWSDLFMDYAVLSGWKPEDGPTYNGRSFQWKVDDCDIVCLETVMKSDHIWYWKKHSQSKDRLQERVKNYEESEVIENVKRECREEEKRILRLGPRWHELQDLPQLFIAV